MTGVTNRFYKMQSDTGCSQVIGFINMTIPHGTSLIANQLFQVNDYEYPQNTANGWLAFLNGGYYQGTISWVLPNNLEILKWNGTGFDTNSYNSVQVRWQPNGDLTLIPGQAEFFVNTNNSPITVPFTGLIPPGPVTNRISPGINFLSSILPTAGRINTDLHYIPNNGDAVLLWTGTDYFTNTYWTATGWTSNEPSLKVGEGFLLIASQATNWLEFPPPASPGFS